MALRKTRCGLHIWPPNGCWLHRQPCVVKRLSDLDHCRMNALVNIIAHYHILVVNPISSNLIQRKTSRETPGVTGAWRLACPTDFLSPTFSHTRSLLVKFLANSQEFDPDNSGKCHFYFQFTPYWHFSRMILKPRRLKLSALPTVSPQSSDTTTLCSGLVSAVLLFACQKSATTSGRTIPEGVMVQKSRIKGISKTLIPWSSMTMIFL